jgi:hypothetical protein
MTSQFQIPCVALTYDIPAQRTREGYPNPSGALRRVGFRFNASCWVVPEHAIPYNLITNLREEGQASVRLLRFDAGEGATIIQMAIEQLNAEIAEQTARTEETIEAARTRILTAVDDDAELRDNIEERKDALKKFEAAAKRNLKALETLLADLHEAAKQFQIDPANLTLGSARTAFDAIQARFTEQAAAYSAATQALRQTNTADAQALATMAEHDAVPAGIIADAVRESGDEELADRVQAAFAPETPAAPTEQPKEEDTFSLAGMGEDGI